MIAQKLGLSEKVAPPEPCERTDLWLHLFEMLTLSRRSDNGFPGAIPLSEIRALLDLMPLPCDNEELIRVVRAMDVEFLDYVSESRGKGK